MDHEVVPLNQCDAWRPDVDVPDDCAGQVDDEIEAMIARATSPLVVDDEAAKILLAVIHEEREHRRRSRKALSGSDALSSDATTIRSIP